MRKIIVFFLVLAVFGTNSTLFAKDNDKQKLAVISVQQKKTAQNSQDHEACEYAKQDATLSTWKQYLDEFPNGECSAEAEEAIDKLACSHAEKAKSIEGWELYLEHQSKGKCSFKAKTEIKKLKKEKETEYIKKGRKIGNLIWSERSSNKMNWNSAEQYCANLSEGGFTDWRLPNIDELRTTIKNCSKTEPGGECKVSEKSGRLSLDDWEPKGSCYCKDKSKNGGYYSKLGDDDNVRLWSPSTRSDYTDFAWHVYFYNGNVISNYKSNNYNVRCVRNAE